MALRRRVGGMALRRRVGGMEPRRGFSRGMKGSGVLALACVPLAIATVLGFLWMGTVSREATDALDPALQRAIAALGKLSPNDREPKAVAAIEGDDLLEGEGRGTPTAIPAASALAPLQSSLGAWSAARDLAVRLMRLDRDVRLGDEATLEKTRAELSTLRERLAASGPPGRDSCRAALDDLARRLDLRLAAAKQDSEADAVYRRAVAALAEGRADESAAAARQCLDLCSPTAQPARADAARAILRRAEFLAAAQRSRAELAAKTTKAEQVAVLTAFVDRFGSAGAMPQAEQTIVERCRRRLDKLQAEIRAEELGRAAQQALNELDSALPPAFDRRLAALADIARRYPASAVAPAARQRIARWMEASLPVKQNSEDAGLEEAVTASREILRGHFREVTLSDGARGYKRFDSAAQRDHPTSDVGTLRREDLAELPGPSLPRRLIDQYDRARRKALQQPQRREHWTELAALCESLESELEAYRKRAGAGGARLSFRDEARFAREAIAPAVWTTLEELWRGRTGS
jgi:hypothetical protein